jgi:hypothetical protein
MEEVSGQDENSNLCITCQRTLKRSVDPPVGIQPSGLHHESFKALETAAEEGCLICNVLLKTLSRFGTYDSIKQNSNSAAPGDFRVDLYGVAESIDADIAPAARGNIWARFFFRFHDKSVSRAAEVAFEGPLAISDRVLGRSTSVSPDFQLARARFHECSQRHTSCPRMKPQPLPTRVIEVGEDIRHGSRLVETRGELGQYLALSHCWGNIQPRPLMTKSDNISILTTRTPFELLGKTFQDAMVVTKHLGYRYLWIDMFCIVQDSVANWQRECSNMASIFANADLTIAASAAKDSNAGFLQKRPVWHTSITEWVRHLSPEYQEQDGS